AMRAEELLPPDRNVERPKLLKGTREAFTYIRSTPRAATVLVLVAVASAFAFNFNVLLPVMAKSTLHAGPGTFGLVTAFFGAGALVGALASAALGRARMGLFLAALAGFAAGEVLLAPLRSIVAAGAVLFVVGLCFTLWTSNANSTLQLEAPSHLRGRVIGLYYYAFNGSGPAAGLFAGWLASEGGTELAFALGGAVTLAAAAVAVARAVPHATVRLAHILGFNLRPGTTRTRDPRGPSPPPRRPPRRRSRGTRARPP